MTQVNIPTELLKKLASTIDNHPLYRSLGLDNWTAYVKEALKVFVECNGECYRKVIREEVSAVADQLRGANVSEKIDAYAELGITGIRSAQTSSCLVQT